MKKRTFILLFGWPEFKSIAGKRWKNLIALIAIIFISLIAIGLGESSTQYLKIKMDDPFIKFVNVTKPVFGSEVSIDNFSKDDLKERYSYEEVTEVRFVFINFMSTYGKEIDATARLIDENSEFFHFLSNNQKILLTKTNYRNNGYGCIVTKSFLDKLGYNEMRTDYIKYVNYRTKDRKLLPIPVAGIVSQLPDYTDVLISPSFYKAIKGLDCLDIENENHYTYLQFYLPKTKTIPEKLKNLGYSTNIDYPLLFNNGIVIIKYGIQNYNLEKDNILRDFPNLIQFYNYSQIPCDYIIKSDPEYFSFSFNDLDSINAFKKYLNSTYGLKIDMSTIEAKENFNFFNKLSTLLSFSLIIFSIFSIFVFTTNQINNHINKNKRNLGTLKAFGLENNSVILIYTIISALLVTIAFLIAYSFSYYSGDLILNMIIRISNIKIDHFINYQNIGFINLSIYFIVIPLIITSINIWIELNNATPGDLIYER